MTLAESFDDDFGDLYTDVEVQASSGVHFLTPLSTGDDAVSGNSAQTDDPEPERINAVEDESAEEEKNGSESEDDLNIVLNDDIDDNSYNFNAGRGGLGFPTMRNGGGCGDKIIAKENGEMCGIGVEGTGLEQSLNGGETGNVDRGCGMNTCSSTLRGNGSSGVASYSSMLVRGEWGDFSVNQMTGACSTASLSGHNFSLPRSRTILDVNIDTLERKPWRYPGADITDFFNFGFDEDSWKCYCNRLDNYRKKVVDPVQMNKFLTHSKVYEYPSEYEGADKVSMSPKFAQPMQRSVSFAAEVSSLNQLPLHLMGRAIKVENSAGERQPSMSTRRSLYRDSDVVIQIAVHDLKEDPTIADDIQGQHDSSLIEALGSKDVGADNRGDFLSLSGASEDNLSVSEGQAEGTGNSPPARSASRLNPLSSYQNNNSKIQIPGADEKHEQDMAEWCEERTVEGLETSHLAKKSADHQLSFALPSMVNPEHDDQTGHGSSPSSFQSCRESSLHSAYIDKFGRPSLIAVSRSPEYLGIDDDSMKDLRRYRRNCSEDYRSYAKDRSLVGDALKLRRTRSKLMSETRTTHLSDDDAFDMSYAERSCLVHHSKGSCKEHLKFNGFESYDSKDISYDEGKEKVFGCFDGRLLDYKSASAHSMPDIHKGYQESQRSLPNFEYQKNRYHKKSRNEKGVSEMEDEAKGWEWYDHEKRVSRGIDYARDEPRRLPNYSPHINNGKITQVKRKADEWELGKRNKSNDFFGLDDKNNYQRREKCRRLLPDKSYQENRHDRNLPSPSREVNCFGRIKMRVDSQQKRFGHASYSDQDVNGRCTRNQSLYFNSYSKPLNADRIRQSTNSPERWRGSISPKTAIFERARRFTGTNRGCQSVSFLDSPVLNCRVKSLGDAENFSGRRDTWHSDVLHLSEDDYNYRRVTDDFPTERTPSFGTNSITKRSDGERTFDHVRHHTNKKPMDLRPYKLVRETICDDKFNHETDFVRRDYFWQKLPQCRDSVYSHFKNGDGKKSSGRRPKAGHSICYGRYKYMDRHSNLIRPSLKDKSECCLDNVAQAGYTRSSSQTDENWHAVFLGTQHDKTLDIEEGQIIPEEISHKTLDRPTTSEDATEVTDGKMLRHNFTNSDSIVVEEQENCRILEIMAKMEQRRERFKQPIVLKKNDGRNLQASVDIVPEASETSQPRPARRRRWGGS